MVAPIALAAAFGTVTLLSALFCMPPGCSMPRGDITGTVRYDGKLVPVGTIELYREGGGIAFIVEFEGGRYAVEKVPPGPHIVTVNTALYRRTWHILKKQRELS